jgi:hypothetical protein
MPTIRKGEAASSPEFPEEQKEKDAQPSLEYRIVSRLDEYDKARSYLVDEIIEAKKVIEANPYDPVAEDLTSLLENSIPRDVVVFAEEIMSQEE